MAIKTTLEQLEEVQAAISRIMTGQDVTVDGKRLRYADLDILNRREQMLLARWRAETGTGGLPAFNTGIIRHD